MDLGALCFPIGSTHKLRHENKGAKIENRWQPASNLSIYGVKAEDAGYVYVFESRGQYKIGRTINPKRREREARTWNPDLNVVGIKPFWNHKRKERLMHIGFSRGWYKREWFRMPDRGYKDTLVRGFSSFDDRDINSNSIEFIYWFNSEGMASFVMEIERSRMNVREFLRQESGSNDS